MTFTDSGSPEELRMSLEIRAIDLRREELDQVQWKQAPACMKRTFSFEVKSYAGSTAKCSSKRQETTLAGEAEGVLDGLRDAKGGASAYHSVRYVL